MRSIPPSVKLEILKAYLNGFSHREIAKESRISLGSVSNVLESLRSERKEFDELRELAQTIKSNNLLLLRMFEATNFLLWLRRNDIKLEFVMNMLDYMNTEGFRFDINIEYFFHRLCSLLIYEKSIGIKIEDLLYLIEEKIGEKQKIEEEINKLYNVYGVTKKQLQEYKNNKALFENFINLQNIYTIPMGKNVIKNEFDYENV